VVDLLRKTWKQFLTSIGNRSENQLTVDVLEETNRAMHLGPISPVVVVGHANSSGTFSGGDASGRMPVVEASAATIATTTNTLNTNLLAFYMGLREISRPDGSWTTWSTSRGQVEIAPVQVIRAGGAVANQQLAPAAAAKTAEVAIYISFYSAAGGTFTLAIAEDHAGTPAAPIPDWNTAPKTFVLPAGVTTWGPFYIMCSTANKSLGLDGSASDCPADGDSVTFWGHYRLY